MHRHVRRLLRPLLALAVLGALLLPSTAAIGAPLLWKQSELASGIVSNRESVTSDDGIHFTFTPLGFWHAYRDTANPFGFNMRVDMSNADVLLARPMQLDGDGIILHYVRMSLRTEVGMDSTTTAYVPTEAGFLILLGARFEQTSRMVDLIPAGVFADDPETGLRVYQPHERTLTELPPGRTTYIYHCTRVREVNPLNTACDRPEGEVAEPESGAWAPPADNPDRDVEAVAPESLTGDPPPTDGMPTEEELIELLAGVSTQQRGGDLALVPPPILPDPPANPPTFPDVVRLTGYFSINQPDQPCYFSATPYTSGEMEMIVDLTLGTIVGGFRGSGGGSHAVVCGEGAGTIGGTASFDSVFYGDYDVVTGEVAMDGLLQGNTMIFWRDCSEAGETTECPAGGPMNYVMDVTLDGTLDEGSLTASGQLALPEDPLGAFGAWAVSG